MGAPANGPTRAEWRALYEVAQRYRELAPWRWLHDVDLFGVQDPATGEVGWCSVFGAAGQVFGLFVYDGAEGLATFNRMLSDDLDPDELPFIQRGWLLSFESRTALEGPDRAVVQELGLGPRGRKAWPRFRSYRPGYAPWFLTGSEACFLTLVLRQATELAARAEVAPEALGPDADGRLLVRVPDREGRGGDWADHRIPPPPAPSLVSPGRLDEARLRRLRLELPRVQAAWECDYGYTPLVIGEGPGRPFYAAVTMFVDQASGFIHGSEIGEPPLSVAFVQQRLLGAMRGFGARPARLVTRRDLVYTALTPVARELDVAIERAARLPELERAQRAMLAYLTKGRPG